MLHLVAVMGRHHWLLLRDKRAGRGMVPSRGAGKPMSLLSLFWSPRTYSQGGSQANMLAEWPLIG